MTQQQQQHQQQEQAVKERPGFCV